MPAVIREDQIGETIAVLDQYRRAIAPLNIEHPDLADEELIRSVSTGSPARNWRWRTSASRSRSRWRRCRRCPVLSASNRGTRPSHPTINPMPPEPAAGAANCGDPTAAAEGP